jgi:hypothetical protein
MRLSVPQALQSEHDELYLQLASAARLGGRLGQAARRLVRLVESHQAQEQRVALRPLGLLKPLSEGLVGEEMKDVLALADALRADLPRLHADHRRILDALEELGEAAREADVPEYVPLAHKLIAHIRVEEEVLYPAALIVGEYVRLLCEPRARTRKAS